MQITTSQENKYNSNRVVHIHHRSSGAQFGYVLCDKENVADFFKIASTASIYKATCLKCLDIKKQQCLENNDLDTAADIDIRTEQFY